MSKDKSELTKKAEVLKIAAQIGCSGAHKSKSGTWMPCSSMEELEKLSQIAETGSWRKIIPGYKKSMDKIRNTGKRRKIKKEWEELEEKPIMGIVSIDSGLVSGNSFGAKGQGPCWEGYVMQGMKKNKKGKLVPNCIPVESKSNIGPEFVRESDPDVFMDPESARFRSRQIGCIGISRRISKNGRSVWMPCTNSTDYANRTGSTALGRRNMRNNKKKEMAGMSRVVVADLNSRRPKRKIALIEQLKNQ